jgi:hypothetical protein
MCVGGGGGVGWCVFVCVSDVVCVGGVVWCVCCGVFVCV